MPSHRASTPVRPRDLEGRLRRVKRGVHHFWEHLEIAHKHQPHQSDDKGNDKKRYPNIIKYHIFSVANSLQDKGQLETKIVLAIELVYIQLLIEAVLHIATHIEEATKLPSSVSPLMPIIG